MSTSDLLILLQDYGYFIVFPLAIIEGPIITIISGLLAHLGYFSFVVVYLVLVLSDMVGCTLYYLAGRYWRNLVWIKKYLNKWGYSENTEKFLEEHFRKHKIETIVIAKFSHGFGWMAHISAGVAKVNYFEFLIFNILSAIPKTLLLMSIGYYIGNSINKINGYLGVISLTAIITVILIVLFFVINPYVKKFWNKDIN